MYYLHKKNTYCTGSPVSRRLLNRVFTSDAIKPSGSNCFRIVARVQIRPGKTTRGSSISARKPFAVRISTGRVNPIPFARSTNRERADVVGSLVSPTAGRYRHGANSRKPSLLPRPRWRSPGVRSTGRRVPRRTFPHASVFNCRAAPVKRNPRRRK